MGCLPAEKFPTPASLRRDRGPATLLDFRHPFPLTRPRDVAGGRITGIRGWICATSSSGSPVMMVQVRSYSPDSGSFQFSQSPAKVNGRLSFMAKSERQLRLSCFAPFVESVGRQRRLAKAFRNDGALSTVSARALTVPVSDLRVLRPIRD